MTVTTIFNAARPATKPGAGMSKDNRPLDTGGQVCIAWHCSNQRLTVCGAHEGPSASRVIRLPRLSSAQVSQPLLAQCAFLPSLDRLVAGSAHPQRLHPPHRDRCQHSQCRRALHRCHVHHLASLFLACLDTTCRLPAGLCVRAGQQPVDVAPLPGRDPEAPGDAQAGLAPGQHPPRRCRNRLTASTAVERPTPASLARRS